MAVIAQNERIDPAKGCRPRSEHDSEAEQPVQGRTDAEIHQILHQDVTRVLSPGKTSFTHGESSLHKENQGSA